METGARRSNYAILLDIVTAIAIIVSMALIARGFGVGWLLGAAAFLTRLLFRLSMAHKKSVIAAGDQDKA